MKIETIGIVGAKETSKSGSTQLDVNPANSVSLKRSSQFVRSDALSPNSVNRLLIESELEKINRRKPNQKSFECNKMVSKNNNEINMESNCSNQKCCKMDKVQELCINPKNRQKIIPNKDEIHSIIEKGKSCKSLEMIQP